MVFERKTFGEKNEFLDFVLLLRSPSLRSPSHVLDAKFERQIVGGRLLQINILSY